MLLDLPAELLERCLPPTTSVNLLICKSLSSSGEKAIHQEIELHTTHALGALTDKLDGHPLLGGYSRSLVLCDVLPPDEDQYKGGEKPQIDLAVDSDADQKPPVVEFLISPLIRHLASLTRLELCNCMLLKLNQPPPCRLESLHLRQLQLARGWSHEAIVAFISAFSGLTMLDLGERMEALYASGVPQSVEAAGSQLRHLRISGHTTFAPVMINLVEALQHCWETLESLTLCHLAIWVLPFHWPERRDPEPHLPPTVKRLAFDEVSLSAGVRASLIKWIVSAAYSPALEELTLKSYADEADKNTAWTDSDIVVLREASVSRQIVLNVATA